MTAYEAPGHLSVSQVHAIQDCPWHWFLERVARVPRLPAWALVGGKAFHAATEELDLNAEGGVWVTDTDMLRTIWQTRLDAEIESEREHTDIEPKNWRASGRASKAWPDKENEAWWRQSGAEMLVNWVQWRLNNPQWEVAVIGGSPAIEAEILGPVGKSMPVKGYIDRVFRNAATGEHLVLDLKTGARTPADAMQLGTYALMLEILFGVRPQWGCYWMARTGSTTTPVDLSHEWPSVRVEHDLMSAEAIVRSGGLSCDRGGYCPTSGVAEHCYACTGIRDGILLPWEVEVNFPPLASGPVLTYGSNHNSTKEGTR